MTDFKSSIITLMDFFASFNQKVLDFNLKLTVKGQVDYATGTLSPGEHDQALIEKAYRKRLVAKDYRFCNTVLTFERGNKFIITSK